MYMKIFAGALAVVLFIIFNGAIAWKLREEPSLFVMMLIGFVMMAVDLYQSLQSKDD